MNGRLKLMSSPSPSTPEYKYTPSSAESDSVTPSLRSKSRNFQMTPLPSPKYSKEEQNQTTFRKNTLEAEIKSLKAEYNLLVKQKNKMKENIVQESELLSLKSQIFYQFGEKLGDNLKNIQNHYLETLHSIHSLESQCDLFERMLQEEHSKREKMLQENNEISDLLNFSQFTLSMPSIDHSSILFSGKEEIQYIDSFNQDQNLRQDILSLQEKLAKVRSDLASADIVKPSFTVQTEASIEFFKSAQAQWQIKGLGLQSYRSEIQMLQKIVTEKELAIKETTKQIEELQNRLSCIQNSETNDSKQEPTKFETRVNNFKISISEMENQIEDLSKRTQKTAESIEQINHELDNLPISIQHLTSTLTERTSFQSSYEEEEDENSNFEEEKVLVQLKESTKSEIEELKKKIRRLKLKERKFEQKTKNEIYDLLDQLKYNKAFIHNQLIFDDINHSSFNNGMKELIRHIDQSIIELKSGL